MKLTDTHCHLYNEYYDDIDEVINNSENLDVDRFICCAVDLDTSKEVLTLCDKYSMIYGALGFHPEVTDRYVESDLEYIRNNITDKIIAIGEIGLDYYYTKENMDKQKDLFIKQLNIAVDVNKPVIIHSREATSDVLSILKTYPLKGIIHSFSGSYETAMEYIKLGYLIGISGVITFKNCNLKDVVEKLPLEHIVIETDAPYLTPVPNRGKQNIPGYSSYTAKFVADIKGVTYNELVEITNSNIKRIFDI